MPDTGRQQPVAPARGARILIVDDEPFNRELLGLFLTADGYQVEEAEGGVDALLQVGRWDPDLVLLDVMMPGMDGYQVATTLRSDPATRRIPILMITALDEREASALAEAAGADAFLTKPVDRVVLALRIAELLGRLVASEPAAAAARHDSLAAPWEPTP